MIGAAAPDTSLTGQIQTLVTVANNLKVQAATLVIQGKGAQAAVLQAQAKAFEDQAATLGKMAVSQSAAQAAAQAAAGARTPDEATAKAAAAAEGAKAAVTAALPESVQAQIAPSNKTAWVLGLGLLGAIGWTIYKHRSHG